MLDDLEAVVALFNAHAMTAVGEAPHNPEAFRSLWTAPGFDLEGDALVVLTPQGKLIGYAEVQDFVEPHVLISARGRVHPDFTRRGLGTQLMTWMEERARQALDKAPVGARVQMMLGHVSTDEGSEALFRELGLEAVRHSFRMEIEFDGSPPTPEVPEGLTIRPYEPESELEETVRTYMDSFRDHWGFVETPFDQMYAYVKHQIDHIPYYDPSLWFVAMDGDEMAAICLCFPRTSAREDTGEIAILGVRQPWRKRGLGLALLHHAFGALYRRGVPRAQLGVDADSLTGATRLYEKAGMHVSRVYHTYAKVLREGEDLMTTSL